MPSVALSQFGRLFKHSPGNPGRTGLPQSEKRSLAGWTCCSLRGRSARRPAVPRSPRLPAGVEAEQGSRAASSCSAENTAQVPLGRLGGGGRQGKAGGKHTPSQTGDTELSRALSTPKTARFRGEGKDHWTTTNLK